MNIVNIVNNALLPALHNTYVLEQNSKKLTAKEFQIAVLQMAKILKQHDVKHGDRICTFLDRNINTVIAAYAILYLGCIYVPLNVNEAKNRLQFIVQDTTPKLIISELNQQDWVFSTDWLNIKEIEWSIDYNDELWNPYNNSDLALILYTSGSTGKPKGVALSHRAIYSATKAGRKILENNFSQRVASLTPFTFALALFDLFTVLYSQATLVFMPQELVLSPIMFSNWLLEKRINFWCTVPTVLSLWSKNVKNYAELPALKAIMFAGEIINVGILSTLTKYLPKVNFYNLYGSTEVNFCCYWKVDRQQLKNITFVPIGRPVFGNILKIKQESSELLVKGETVMSGYWSNNTFIKQRGFINTGDIVEVNEYKQYVCKGRHSRMFKHLGFRIHPFEIETNILKLPEVEECIVMQFGQERRSIIVSFVVLKKRIIKKSISKNILKNLIPYYMIPEEFVYLQALPKLSNKKVDVQKLRELYNNSINNTEKM